MTVLGMKYREDVWFVGGLLLVALLGIVAGITLNIILLGVVTVLLVFVWLAVFLYCIIGRPGPSAVWLALAIPVLIIATWLSVVVSVWGFVR